MKKYAMSILGNPDWLFALAVIAYLLSYLYMINGLQSVPTCLTCDYYFEQGNIIHLAESFNLASDSSSHLGHLSQGPQLAYFLPVIFVWLTKASVLQANLILSFIAIPAALFIYYKLFQREIGNREIALACALAAFGLTDFPLLKYSEYALALSIPIFFWLLTGYFRKPTARNALLLGLGIGMMGLSHANTFFLSYILTFTFAGAGMLFSGNWKEYARKHALLIPACAIGFLISLAWWYKPLFVFGGSSYMGFGWATYDLANPQVYAAEIISAINDTFDNAASAKNIVFSAIWTIGILSMAIQRGAWKKNPAALAAILAFFIATFHFIITSPAIGRDISPMHSFRFLYPVTTAFVLWTILDFNGKEATALALAAAVLLVAVNVSDAWQKKDAQLFALGFEPIDPCLSNLSSYVAQHTAINDVFLSASYPCNTLNGLTGRKCMQMDRGHSSKFDNIDESYVEAAIIIYGNASADRGGLLENNSVDYFYWNFADTPMGDNAIVDAADGSIVHANPILYSAERERELKDNGVKYLREMAYLDSSARSAMFKKYDALVLQPPGNVYSASHPWKPELDRYLEKVWECGNTSVIYKIKKQE